MMAPVQPRPAYQTTTSRFSDHGPIVSSRTHEVTRHALSDHLNLEEIAEAERKARAARPILFRVAEFVVFVRDPVRWIRSWRQRRALGYDGNPRR